VEGTHADNDFVSRSGLAYETGDLVDVADANRARLARGVRRRWLAHDDTCDRSVMQYLEVRSVASLLIEAVVAGAPSQHAVHRRRSVLDTFAVSEVEILDDRDVGSFAASNDESFGRWWNVSLEAELKWPVAISIFIERLVLLAERRKLRSRGGRIQLRTLLEEAVDIVPAPARVT